MDLNLFFKNQSIKMKNLDLILNRVVSMYQPIITYEVLENNDDICVLRFHNEDIQDSLLKIEILSNGNIGVLERRSIGYNSITTFMDILMKAIDDFKEENEPKRILIS